MEQVARHDALGLGGQELLPGRTRSARGRIQPFGLQDRPHRRGPDPVAEPGQLAVDAPVAPVGVLRGQAFHQCPQTGRGRRATRWPIRRGGPPPGDQTSMPTQDCPRRDEHAEPPGGRQPQRERRDDRPVRPCQPRPSHLAMQHRELMAQDEDLGVLRRVRTGQQRQSTDQTTSDQVPQTHPHPTIMPARPDRQNPSSTPAHRVSGTGRVCGRRAAAWRTRRFRFRPMGGKLESHGSDLPGEVPLSEVSDDCCSPLSEGAP